MFNGYGFQCLDLNLHCTVITKKTIYLRRGLETKYSTRLRLVLYLSLAHALAQYYYRYT